ncbi:MAG: hypothetical protein B7Y61_16980 [Rhizobiales bacterium 35-66-30]|nr:MAG: hypothetical protein B7Y61_16980 [Rhizobiales bacterium 35-66-30]
MYAANSTVAGPALQERLQDIEIVKINGRIGNDLRNDLIYNLTGGAGNPANAPYKMFITVRSSSSFAIVDTQSGLPEAKTYRVEGDWKLVRAGEETKPPIASGKAAAAVSTDVSEQRFANYSSARDAESRASQVVADQIKVQLAAFFIKNPTGTPQPAGGAAAGRNSGHHHAGALTHGCGARGRGRYRPRSPRSKASRGADLRPRHGAGA